MTQRDEVDNRQWAAIESLLPKQGREQLTEADELDLERLFIDSSVVRATRASAGGGKGGPQEPEHHALGRSREGFSTKIHLACERHGVVVSLALTPGQASDLDGVAPVLDEVRVQGRRGPPCRRPSFLAT
ncbi:transposase [Melittangium boletus]|uniref:transposase n=1 Tax=Melittangium boletus TaxID=83453 RepID=UPI003DA23CC3